MSVHLPEYNRMDFEASYHKKRRARMEMWEIEGGLPLRGEVRVARIGI